MSDSSEPATRGPYDPPPEAAPAARRRGLSRRTWTLLLSGLLVAVFGVAGVSVNVPYVALGAGPLYDTLGDVGGEPVIQIEGEESFETSGTLSLTTVSVADGVTMFDALARWASGQFALAPREQYFEPGVSEEEIQEENLEQFQRSQSAAEVAALRSLEHPVGVFAEEVQADEAAGEVIDPGSQLISLDGVEVAEVSEVHEALEGSAPGDEVEVAFRAPEDDAANDGENGEGSGAAGGDNGGDNGAGDGTAGALGEEQTETLELGQSGDRDQGFLGIILGEQALVDFDINITLADVGGPSAGIMFAVAIVDRLTEEDLVAGQDVAGTGMINFAGGVGPIGGIGFKIDAAEEAGADTFLVPEPNCGEALAAASEDLTLISVQTLDDAVSALQAGAAGESEDVPTC